MAFAAYIPESRCVNCGVRFQRNVRKHLVSELPEDFQQLIRVWIFRKLHLLDTVCGKCLLILQESVQAAHPIRSYGYRNICIPCGISILRERQTHAVPTDSAEWSIMSQWVLRHQVERLNQVCIACWSKAYRAVHWLRKYDDYYEHKMSKRTVLNENYKGLVENFSIPAELHERDGKKYASFGSAVPIHCCTPEQVKEHANTTHHYCDVFTEQVLAPLGELAYVRLDENTAEKVFINRNKRILLTSSDGRLAQWRAAPTFESANTFVCGAPLVSKDGALVSLVTARRGNHYAVSSFEGEGGYFDTTEPWTILEAPEGVSIYGDKTFSSREALRQHVASLPPADVSPARPPRPLLYRGRSPRIILVDQNGRQISHQYLHGVATDNIEYL